MESPRVQNSLVDPDNNVTYHVMAYRRLTEQELRMAVQYYLANRRRKSPDRNKTITIVSSLGLADSR